MKRFIVFILIWAALVVIPSVIVDWYSDGLYLNYFEKEEACNTLINQSQKEVSKQCLAENILEIPQANRTPIQNEIVLAYEKADYFNVTLFLVVVGSFLMGAILSWYYVYKRKIVFA